MNTQITFFSSTRMPNPIYMVSAYMLLIVGFPNLSKLYHYYWVDYIWLKSKNFQYKNNQCRKCKLYTNKVLHITLKLDNRKCNLIYCDHFCTLHLRLGPAVNNKNNFRRRLLFRNLSRSLGLLIEINQVNFMLISSPYMTYLYQHFHNKRGFRSCLYRRRENLTFQRSRFSKIIPVLKILLFINFSLFILKRLFKNKRYKSDCDAIIKVCILMITR